MNQPLSILSENVAIIQPAHGLKQKLAVATKENRPLNIKLGFDPTAPDLHLGHAVVLKKIKQFQDLGHQIHIIVGSFTAQIGDPTGKNKSRPPLDMETIERNATTYIEQLSKIIDVDKAQIHFNSEWLSSLSSNDMIQLLSKVTVAQLMHRNDFNKRFQEQQPIGLHELMYPILQGFDSTKIQADIELGGTDQLFNCNMGRQLQEQMEQAPQVVLCMPLLRGLDGSDKMSKSLNNIIGLTDAPNEMFGKMMSIPDALIEEYIDLTTDFDERKKHDLKQRLAIENPMLIKKIIAQNIIQQYHCQEDAIVAEQFFNQQFQQRNNALKSYTPVDITAVKGQMMNIVAMGKLCQPQLSNSELRRLITQGAVLINEEKVTDVHQKFSVHTGMKIKIGKLNFFEFQ